MDHLQCVQSLEILSYIQFARVNLALYDHIVHKIVLKAAEEQSNVQQIIDLLPPQVLGKYKSSGHSLRCAQLTLFASPHI